MGRFISADALVSTGQGILGNNMFAYCGNNPVNYTDSTGQAYKGINPQIHYNEHDHAYGGLRDNFYGIPDTVIDAVVVDFSWSFQSKQTLGTYYKIGGTILIDFQNTEAYIYFHGGTGVGLSKGPTLSAGYVADYSSSKDYEGWFQDINAAYYLGLDHCWSPDIPYDAAPKAVSVSISAGPNIGVGRDFYFPAIYIGDWA